MAVIHRTTMVPTKMELLTSWLPGRAWYRGEKPADLHKAGGFRLDDPDGEVGIEFVVITDHSGAQPHTYHVPLTYRGAPLPDAAEALVGTSEHGVLGTRWVYDATRDPVAVAQIISALIGNARPQAQSESDTPDPSVTVHVADTLSLAGGFGPARDGLFYTDIPVGDRILRIHRLLQVPVSPAESAVAGRVDAWWRLDDTTATGVFISLTA
ncbi:maltokinase N-terminal cap-like domain-containing protein [Nocardia sp. SC052]|uniref:maltokinase N-terminal cap-like domain-containing protein n=1 Tax=Nocardia sichangensis TaxID=3385975 RepID=UPI0039A1F2DF